MTIIHTMGVDIIAIKISMTDIIYFFDNPKYTYSAVTFQKNRNIVKRCYSKERKLFIRKYTHSIVIEVVI